MDPNSRAGKILSLAASLSKATPNHNFDACSSSYSMTDQNYVGPINKSPSPLRPVAVVSPSRIPKNDGELKEFKFKDMKCY